MKRILTTMLIAVSMMGYAQTHSIYVSPSVGPYINTSVKTPLDMMGYALEVGYCYKGMVNAGVSYGTLDFGHKNVFVQARTGFTFLERPAFSLTAAAGLGYAIQAKELISEGDMIANICPNRSI